MGALGHWSSRLGGLGRIAGLLLGLAVLGACGPVYQTVYDYTPPPTAQGQLCASKCGEISRLCTQNCSLREDRCVAEARERGARDFERYVRDRQDAKLPIEKDVDDFTYTGGCYTSSSCSRTCDEDYRRCFTGCGGQVTSRQVCTAFCN